MRYKLALIHVELVESRSAIWAFTRKSVRGIEHKYRVRDRNFAARNEWTCVVRVSKNPRDHIEVRPVDVPTLAAWANLERRSLTFPRATRPGYTNRRYCFVAIADYTGQRTKRTAGRGQREALPPWFQQLRSRMRLKKTVRPTHGTDGDKLVLLAAPDDHATMIRYFFPTKVWPLKDRRGLRE